MIELRNISKSYPEFTIKNFNLCIENGHIVSLLGESGSGKSTILKIMTNLISDYTGDVIIDGKISRNIPPIHLGMSMIFQQSLLLPHLNVEDNISFGMNMLKIPKAKQKIYLQQALEEVKMTGFEQRHPSQLSGGQMQRVAIARALVMQPKVLLMDEPFSALDPNLRVEMQSLIKEIQSHRGTTVVCVTHDLDEAFFLSDHIALIRDGELIQYGTPKDLFHNPVNIYAAKFLGMKNIFRGSATNSGLCCKGITIPTRPIKNTKDTAIAIKSNDLWVDTQPTSQFDQVLTGIVKNVSLRHGFYEIEAQIDGITFHVVQNNIPQNLKKDETIYVHYNHKNMISLSL
ncbi:MAG: ABC transporter ATP-binding protein [Brevinema sp.]